MKSPKKEVLKYILDTNNQLYGDMLPILDIIFSQEIKEKLNFGDTKKNFYFEFNSSVFEEINIHCLKNRDSLGELIFFYFENKIMNELDKAQKEDVYYISKKAKHFRNFVSYLEKNYNNIKENNNFLSITFVIALIKCFIYKIIKIFQENPNNIDSSYLFGEINYSSKNSPFRTSIKLYIIKLIVYYNGNFSDLRNINFKQYGINEILDVNTKEFGFDSMFIPLNSNNEFEVYSSLI